MQLLLIILFFLFVFLRCYIPDAVLLIFASADQCLNKLHHTSVCLVLVLRVHRSQWPQEKKKNHIGDLL